LQEANHLLAELQVVMADKAALEDEKAAAQVNNSSVSVRSRHSMLAWSHQVMLAVYNSACSARCAL
jgi:hypothetical protein